MQAPDVVVVGGGHVGSTPSLVLAESGSRVGIVDVSRETLDSNAAGRMPFWS